MSQMVQSEQKLRLPKGSWPACCRHCLHRVCTDALRKSLSKALHFYIRSLRKGATTTCGMLVEKRVKHLKVSWSNLRQRVRVFLKNVFALRFLWRRCFGELNKMRWVSWDQKPAWFNNTALDATYSTIGYEPLVKEIEAHSRQRFTVCTCVDSATTGDPDKPPPVGVLFKAAPRGIVWAELTVNPLNSRMDARA